MKRDVRELYFTKIHLQGDEVLYKLFIDVFKRTFINDIIRFINKSLRYVR